MSRLLAIVPVKALAEAKSRLAPVLPGPRRAALMLDLLEHVLDVLANTPAVTRYLVVSPDERVLDEATASGALVLRQHGRGLNQALELAARYRRAAERLLVLPADLPLLRPQHLDGLLAASHGADAVVVPDAAGSGTNALLFAAGRVVPFCFGVNSCARHRAAAAGVGIRMREHRVAEMAFDLDTPADYLAWRRATGPDVAGAGLPAVECAS